MSLPCLFVIIFIVRIFKNTWFFRFADKEGITDDELKNAVTQLESGQFDADLGGNVYKVRVARSGEGKSGGYRVIVFFRNKERAFFVYGFAKSARDNIDQGELRGFKAGAKVNLSLTDIEIDNRIKKGTLIEIS